MRDVTKSVTPREFETLVANLQRKFSNGGEVLQNSMILGRLTERKREVDVVIRSRIAGENILVAVECKRRGRKSDVNQVEAFSSKLEDIGANKGIMVSAKGFSKAAKNLATKKGISLYRYEDTLTEGWPSGLQTSVLIRVWELYPTGAYSKRRNGSKTDIITDTEHRYLDVKTGQDTPLATVMRKLWDTMPENERSNGDHCIECATNSPDDPEVNSLGLTFQSFRHSAMRFGMLQFEGFVDDDSCVAKAANWKMIFPRTEIMESERSTGRGSALTLQVFSTHIHTDDSRSAVLLDHIRHGHFELSIGSEGMQELPFSMPPKKKADNP